MSVAHDLLGMAQRVLSRVPGAPRWAASVRNQCNMIIAAALATGNRLDDSGEPWLASLVAPTARCFVDVGANVGDWALTFAGQMRQSPQGLLLEPNPATAAHLRQRLAGLGFANCEVIEAAAGDAPGRLTFFAEEGFGQTSSFYRPLLQAPATQVEVEVLKLDDILAARGVEHVDMLKIDAEGHDFRVIEGAAAYLQAGKIDVIQFEYNRTWLDAGCTLAHAFAYLKQRGYETALLRRDGLHAFDLDRIGDFFNYSNFVAVRAEGLPPELKAALAPR